MRDIKFRAWNVDDEIMLYSDFNAMGFYSLENAQEIAENTETVFMYHAYTGDKDFVLLQYTGLKDVNGKEIYEGDIIKFCFKDGNDINTQYMEVLYREPMFVMREIYRDYWLEKKDGGGLLLRHGILESYKGDISPLYKSNATHWTEVIGNIYLNPELLTQYEDNVE